MVHRVVLEQSSSCRIRFTETGDEILGGAGKLVGCMFNVKDFEMGEIDSCRLLDSIARCRVVQDNRKPIKAGNDVTDFQVASLELGSGRKVRGSFFGDGGFGVR